MAFADAGAPGVCGGPGLSGGFGPVASAPERGPGAGTGVRRHRCASRRTAAEPTSAAASDGAQSAAAAPGRDSAARAPSPPATANTAAPASGRRTASSPASAASSAMVR